MPFIRKVRVLFKTRLIFPGINGPNMFTDIDECKNLTTPCGKYNFIRCENTVGDYLCRCYHGFEFSKESKECKGN